MAVFFVRFKAMDPIRGRPYFANFEMPYDSVDDALEALNSNVQIVVTRYYAVHKPSDRSTLTVKRSEVRTLSLDDVAMLSLSRFKFEFDLGKSDP